MKVIIDTNVLISALLWQGLPNDVLKLVKEAKFELCITPYLLEELSGVLHRDKFSPRLLTLNTSAEELANGIMRSLKVFPDRNIPPTIRDDLDDDRVLSCAKVSGAKYIITGDPHLLKLKTWSGISILTPRQFLNTCFDNRPRSRKIILQVVGE